MREKNKLPVSSRARHRGLTSPSSAEETAAGKGFGIAPGIRTISSGMSIVYEERRSDLPYVEAVTHGQTESDGSTVRPAEPIELERTMVIEAPGVTHLRFRVAK